MFLVKLGGGLITDKRHRRVMDPKNLRNAVAEVAAAWRALGGPEGKRAAWGIVVIGAGSFGHHAAKIHGFDRIGKRTDAQRAGIADVHADVAQLHTAVLREFFLQRVPVYSLPPRAWAVQEGGELPTEDPMDPTAFEWLLSDGLIPLTFGDLVLDRRVTASLLSGDTIMTKLANHFEPPRAVFAMKEDGVCVRAPTKKEPKPPVIPELEPEWLPPEEGAKGRKQQDATGGMRAKVAAAHQIAKYGVEVLFVNGGAKGRLRDALLGKPVVGTRRAADHR